MRKRYVFLLPLLVFLAFVFVIPVLMGIVLPFFSGEGTSQEIRNGSFSFAHFIESVSSGAGTGLIDAIRNTLIYTFCVSCGCIILGLFGALLVTQKFPSAGIVR
ncbi:MAG: sugar ABC transporter permease, partial [Fibrobacter sp.]|nr:sugar ABC transporter permease [Fibrobacter sp.]